MAARQIGKYISILNRQAQRYLHDVVSKYGIGYSSYFFVMYIGANPKCSQREMCESIVMDEAMATREMRKLLKSGYIVRQRRAGDAKTYEISLSESGKELYEKLKEKLLEWWGSLSAESGVDPELLTEQLGAMARVAHEKLIEHKMEGNG
ncbi:hypothetical protein B5F37_00745 [Drancourtella sp. An210]|nr:hypothetical protein B5F37_00745 [Drancourtella sp. An210]